MSTNPEWRLLDLYMNSYPEASAGIAPSIAKARIEGIVPDTLALVNFRRPGVVMGYFHSPERDVDLQYAKENGIDVIRFPAQGLIFGHKGYLGIWSYADKKFFPDSIPEVFRYINEMVGKKLEQKFAIRARHRPLNDLEALIGGSWKKIGPHGAYFQEGICIDRFCLTVTPVPMEQAERVLVVPKEKFADKSAKSIRERIGSLSEAVGSTISMDEIREVMIDAFCEGLGIELARGCLTEKEMDYERNFFEKHTRPEWFFARAENRAFQEASPKGIIKEGIRKVKEGPLIRACICVEDRIIRGVFFSGTFFPLQDGENAPHVIEELERSIVGLEAEPSKVRKAILDNWKKISFEVVGAKPEDFAEAVLDALARG